MAPGTTERWRIVNACTSRVLALRLEGQQLVQVAQDGSFLSRPTRRDTLVLAPGNRADVVVQPRDTGRFALLADPYDRGSMMGGSTGSTGNPGPTTLATLVTSGPLRASTPLPAVLPAETLSTTPISRNGHRGGRLNREHRVPAGGAGRDEKYSPPASDRGPFGSPRAAGSARHWDRDEADRGTRRWHRRHPRGQPAASRPR